MLSLSKSDLKKKLVDLVPELKAEFAVAKLGLFGSYAREEQTEKSDIDLLVQFRKPVGWKSLTLELFLEEKLGRKIDLVTEAALRKEMKSDILNRVEYIV